MLNFDVTKKHMLTNPTYECACGFRTDFHDLFVKHLLEREQSYKRDEK